MGMETLGCVHVDPESALSSTHGSKRLGSQEQLRARVAPVSLGVLTVLSRSPADPARPESPSQVFPVGASPDRASASRKLCSFVPCLPACLPEVTLQARPHDSRPGRDVAQATREGLGVRSALQF